MRALTLKSLLLPPLLAWALAAGLPMCALARDKDPFPADQPNPPPEPVPMQIEVPRGGPVLITLSAYSLTSPIIRFRIKRTTDAGQLGTPRLVTASTAVVRYVPPRGAGPGDDSFEFAVQSEAGVSASAEVVIKITDKPALFIAPTDVEFGGVLPGATARQTLTLQNLGGSVAEGTVRVPDGWSVEGDPDYRLEGGQKQTFTLVFTPAEERPYTGDVEYTGNHERATDLNGEGIAPLAVTTGTVELAPAGAGSAGAIHVENHTAGVLTVRLTPGSQVQTPGTADIPANGAADVPVRVAAAGEINDHVTVEGQGLKEDVTIHAAATPAPVEADSPTPGPSLPAPSPAKAAVVASAAAAPAPASDAPASSPDDGSSSSMSLPPLAQDGGQDSSAPEAMPMGTLQLGPVGRTDAEVGCDFKGCGQAQTYRLEMQTVGRDPQGRPAPLWVPLTATTLTTKGQLVLARMNALQPGSLYVVRLAGLDDQGNVIEVSSTQAVWTVPELPSWWRRWMKDEIGLVILLGAGWWLRRRLRRRW